MAKPIIPVLMSDINQLSTPVDIIKYCLRSYMYLPKNISDSFPDEELSFRWDDASVGNDSEAIGDRIRLRMTRIFAKYFPTASSITVTPSVSMLDEVRYSITIDIVVVIDSTPHSISSNFVKDAQGNLSYTFNGS